MIIIFKINNYILLNVYDRDLYDEYNGIIAYDINDNDTQEILSDIFGFATIRSKILNEIDGFDLDKFEYFEYGGCKFYACRNYTMNVEWFYGCFDAYEDWWVEHYLFHDNPPWKDKSDYYGISIKQNDEVYKETMDAIYGEINN